MLQAVSESGNVLLWGATPGERDQHVTKWERIRAGDYVFFSRSGEIFCRAVVTSVLRNRPLAEAIWGTTESRNGRRMSWELMFSIDAPVSLSMPYESLNRIIGRKPGSVVQEFNVLTQQASEALLQALGLGDSDYAAPPSFEEYEEAVLTPAFERLERDVVSRQRLEQRLLRKVLLKGARDAECELCGRTFPVEFLTAAHIKRRAACSDAEKRDLANIAMLNCRFGCDELWGRGMISVNEIGALVYSPLLDPKSSPAEYVRTFLAGRSVPRWHDNERSRIYFASHLASEFRRAELTSRVSVA